MNKNNNNDNNNDDDDDETTTTTTTTSPPTPSAILAAQSSTSNHVYVLHDDYAWVPARVLETTETTALVSIPEYKDEQLIQSDGGRAAKKFTKRQILLSDYPNAALLLQNVSEEGLLKEVEDMVDLPFLHEVSIL